MLLLRVFSNILQEQVSFIFRAKQFKKSSWTAWRHYDPSKCWELLTK